MRNPTGGKLRGTDGYGSGRYYAERTSGTIRRPHRGIDLLCTPGQVIVAPMAGVIWRRAKPYGDGKAGDDGFVIQGPERDGLSVKMFYARAYGIGGEVREGEPIATALSLQERYPGISDHLHLEVWDFGQPIDPMPFFEGLETA